MKVRDLWSRRLLWLLVVSFVSMFAAKPSLANTSPDYPTGSRPATLRLPGHVLSAIAKASVVPSSAKSESGSLSLTLVLKRDDQAGFERFLHDLYDPKSPAFHHFLTQRQIANRFGPSRADYNSVLRWMKSKGFKLERGSKNRLTLTVRGTRAQAERAFGVGIRDYRIGKHQFYANERDPALPLALAPLVQAVNGLSNYAQPRPTHIAIFSAVCAVEIGLLANVVGLNPNTANGKACILGMLAQCINSNATAAGYGVQINAQYPPCNLLGFDLSPETAAVPEAAHTAADPTASPWQSATGAGETVGLIEFDNFQSSDVSGYLSLVGLPATAIGNLSEVNVDGGASIGSGEDEVLLDIDTVMTIAPGAKVAVYDAPFTGSGASFQRVFNQMIDNGVSIISNSWAYCEDETTAADVDSIDSIFQNAAAAHISIFNGAGDSGSTCLDGGGNTVAVPADSPNATAVGGSSLTPGPGYTYGTETWWNDSKTSPPAGQGGFGTSKFFSAPGYQGGFGVTNRSVPDVVSNADPFHGVEICQADDGGCPNGKQYGGTSMSAPAWAGYTALLNQSLGANMGFLNPTIYPLAGTDAFHSAASLTSDFAHVGLGSPNLEELHQMLASESVGAVDASVSEVLAYLQNGFQPAGASAPSGEPADGTSKSAVTVNLFDSNGNAVSGKTVTLTANAGNHATISPPSAISGAGSGLATFTVTDETPETLTLTAKDTTDSITLGATPTLAFVSPMATQAGLGAFPTTVTADGAHPTTITVTLEDTLGRPSPGKQIQLNQTGNSVITGPIPQVTDAAGQIVFTGYDTDDETVTYTATDVTDGNLAFPESAQVTFSSGPETGCGNGNPMSAPGYLVTPYVTGLFSENFSFAGGDFGGCPGAWGLAFDASGNLYVGEEFNGAIYKIPSGGGAASASNLIGTIGPTLGQLVFDGGNLYAVRASTGSNLGTGAVLQIDPSTGAVLNTVVGNLNCPLEMAIDPLSGDLFVDDGCEGPNGSGALLRISHLATTPTVSTYATLPNQGNYQITFAADGTIYVFSNAGNGQIVEVGSTASTQPASVNVLSAPTPAAEFLAASGTAPGGGAQFLIFDTAIGTLSNAVATLDLTTSPPSTGSVLVNSGISDAAENATFGPDGCLYIANGNEVLRISDPDGTCGFVSSLSAPSLVLTPTTVLPNPPQGNAQTFTARFHNATAPTGTPVTFQVTGANPQIATIDSNSAGKAAFTYVAVKQGVDTIIASAALGAASVNSNSAVVTWGPGTDVTFLTLNASPSSAPESQLVTVTANLTDLSANPPAVVPGETVNFTTGGVGCGATTDSNGNAACQLTPSGTGLMTLAANFPGTGQFNPSSDTKGFTVVVASPPTPTATATATRTATPTATPTPVAGKLKIEPKTLNFGDVAIGASPTKSVKIINAGKVKKKKHPLPILIEMETGVTSPFTLTQECPDDDDLGPKSKGVAAGSCELLVEFKPTAAMKYSGTLIIDTNLESLPDRSVKLEGTGKAPKK